MNIRQVKEKYSLQSVLGLLGHMPDSKKSKTHDLWYKSPFRPGEDTPSFHVNVNHDIYKDFGDGEKGGDLIWFAQRYLQTKGQGASVSDALRWFEELGNEPRAIIKRLSTQKQKPNKDPYRILSIKPIFSKNLFAYLYERKIPIPLAMKYLDQVYFQHLETNTKLYGLGFLTRVGSYDIRNALGFKTMIGKKDISFIAGENNTKTVEVFEGVMDFLSYLTIEKRNVPKNDVIILNSANLHEQASEYILQKAYSKIILWPDNDDAGRAFKTKIENRFSSRSVSIHDKSNSYSNYKDLNEFLIKTFKVDFFASPPDVLSF